jgi:serine/threonine protein kinase
MCCFPVASSAGQGFDDRYKLQEELGTGSFGQVRAAVSIRETAASTQKAVKIIDLSHGRGCADTQMLRAAKQEAKLWGKIGKHPNCIELLRTFVEGGVFMMVAEKADACVMERMREVRHLPEEGLLRIAREMLSGVAHCHKRRIVHRDIKLENFLICGAAGTVKLCDFGLSARMPRGGGLLYGTHGTAPYMSVEMILNKGHDTSTDVWSLGVSWYVVLYGDFPYRPKVPSSAAMKQAVVSGFPLPSFEGRGSASRRGPWRPQRLVSLTKRMMERGPASRCSAADALSALSPGAPNSGFFTRSSSSLSSWSTRAGSSSDSLGSSGGLAAAV